jgi:hypothetical protein
MFRREGIWQSADFRIRRGSQIIDDGAPKQLTIQVRPHPGGPLILLGFTGLAEVAGVPTLQWIRETLRGENRTLHEIFDHLTDRLNRDVRRSPSRSNLLVLCGGVQQGDQQLAFELCNADPATLMPAARFKLAWFPVDHRLSIHSGSGRLVVAQADKDLIMHQLQRRPRRWKDHHGLLAAVNRRTAALDPNRAISPGCYVSSIGIEVLSRAYNNVQYGDPPSFTLPYIFQGIDMTDQMHALKLSLAKTDFAGGGSWQDALALAQQTATVPRP